MKPDFRDSFLDVMEHKMNLKFGSDETNRLQNQVVKKPRGKKAYDEQNIKCIIILKREILDHCLKNPLGAFHPNIGVSWYAAIREELGPNFFKVIEELDSFLTTERQLFQVFPKPDEVWRFTHDFDVQETKVVIIGQDPYIEADQANGLAFSVDKGQPIPPSLQNIFSVLHSDIEGFKRPSHGDLSSWSRQGVLLLDTCLTVREGYPSSHDYQLWYDDTTTIKRKQGGWEYITEALVKQVNKKCTGVVFMLWGNKAILKNQHLIDKEIHMVLISSNPNSKTWENPGKFGIPFKECQHFSKCNTWLKEQGKETINWNIH